MVTAEERRSQVAQADKLTLSKPKIEKVKGLPRQIICRDKGEVNDRLSDTIEDVLAASRDDGGRVLLVDDLIATGGTARAVGDITRRLGATVSARDRRSRLCPHPERLVQILRERNGEIPEQRRAFDEPDVAARRTSRERDRVSRA